MKTKLKTLILNKDQTNIAADIIKNGGTVAVPTETVYGLCANAMDKLAVNKIFKAKGRPSDNPLIVHIYEFSEIYSLVKEVPEPVKKLVEKFWPGPLTVILPKSAAVPYSVTAGLESVAVRLPANEIMRRIIKLCGTPIAAPSANTSGKPSPTKFKHVLDDLDGKIDAILDGGDCTVGVESTVVSFTGAVPKLLRPGKVTVCEIERIIGKIDVDRSIINEVADNQPVASPGMKYKHYSPNANVVVLDCSREKFIDYVNSKDSTNVAALCYDEDLVHLDVLGISYGKEGDYDSMARKLFDALRKIDEYKNIKTVYARCPQPSGEGLAIYNRLIRAAGFEVQKID